MISGHCNFRLVVKNSEFSVSLVLSIYVKHKYYLNKSGRK